MTAEHERSSSRPLGEHPPIAEHWLTYAEAADRLGLTPEAVRALARRQHWPRRSPNAVGGQTWIVVPADRLAAGDAARLTLSANGHADSGHRTPPASGRRAHSGETTPANGQNANSHRTPPAAPPDTGDHSDRRIDEVLTAVHEAAETLRGLANHQIETLTTQLGVLQEQANRERERADRADDRAREAETRVRELQDQLQGELIEHRRVVSLLSEQLAARRSWWRWRR